MKKLFYVAFIATLVAIGCEKNNEESIITNINDNYEINTNELHYTSSDGEIITPINHGDGFGGKATIVSNTYRNGIGVIVFDKPITKIATEAFCNYKRLTGIKMPLTVKSIETAAFHDCSLSEIIIPDSVNRISIMFDQMPQLSKIYCKPTTPPTLGNSYGQSYNIFTDIAEDAKIYVPVESLELYKKANNWSEYINMIVPFDYEKWDICE